MTCTQQSLCLVSITKKENAEKTEAAENADPMTNLVNSLDRLTMEINGLLNEQPHSYEALTDISREAMNAYEKLTAFYEKFKNNTICENTLGRKK